MYTHSVSYFTNIPINYSNATYSNITLYRRCSMKPTANKAQPAAAKAQPAARQAVAAAASAQPAAAEGGGRADEGEDLEEMRKRLQALRG